MNDILSQLLTGPVKVILTVVAIILIILWLLSIVWVNRDARARKASSFAWTIIAIIPIAGLVAYCLLRPTLTTLDQDEQDMELDLLQRQLDAYGECPNCGYPTERDYVICPKCHKQLRNKCTHCGKSLEPEWSLCPYCTTPVAGRRGAQQRTTTPATGTQS